MLPFLKGKQKEIGVGDTLDKVQPQILFVSYQERRAFFVMLNGKFFSKVTKLLDR